MLYLKCIKETISPVMGAPTIAVLLDCASLCPLAYARGGSTTSLGEPQAIILCTRLPFYRAFDCLLFGAHANDCALWGSAKKKCYYTSLKFYLLGLYIIDLPR